MNILQYKLIEQDNITTNIYLPATKISTNKSSSIVRSTNVDKVGRVFLDEHAQQCSVAPTLPLHSPHSPLLIDKTTINHFNEAKLSARYINNANYLYNGKKSNIPNVSKQNKNCSVTKESTSTTLASKLLCYCEKNETQTLKHLNSKISLDTRAAKRLVPTRNAATSPHLDIRKLGGLATLTPSPSIKSELCVKSIDCKNNKLQIPNKNVITFEREYHKTILEKPNTISKPKSKPLRTTRSLSPRPPVRHQYAMLVSDSDNININIFPLPKNNSLTNKPQINKLCRSEQSSPNVIDGREIKFSYNESTNRSTGCLGNVIADPWFKSTCSDNKTSSFILSATKEKGIDSANVVTESNKDPWVKRSDVECISKVSRQALFRQTKSFSASKFNIESIMDSPLTHLSPGYLNPEIQPTATIDAKKQLQSAPTSPQFLTTSENIFNSSIFLDNKHSTEYSIEKSPIRSSSFSPARIKDSHNPFKVGNLHLPKSPPPIISVAADIIKEQTKSKSNILSTNLDFLNVCNPNLLNARHSISSVADHKQEEELQLNIRRLSDQMRRKELTSNNSIKTFTSDRNVRDYLKDKKKEPTFLKVASNPSSSKDFAINRVDFSKYLEQFKCSGAKKTTICEENPCSRKENMEPKTANNQANVVNRNQSDCLLETTC